MGKRILSVLLAMLMLLSLMPMSAMADDSVTRVEWIQRLVAAFEMEVAADNYPDNYYSDISSDDEFYRDIMVATEFGLIDTEPGTAFEPNAAATREFAAHTLNHCLGFQLDEGAAYTFSDADALTYAVDAQIAINRGWFKLIDGKFAPETLMTAAESDTMLADAGRVIAGETIEVGHNDTFTYTEGVIEIPRSAAAKLGEDGRLVLTGYAGELRTDDIVAVYTGVFPTIYKLGAVESADGTIAAAVTELNADDYITAVNAEGSVKADLADTEAAEDATVTYIFENGTETQDQKLAKASSMKIKDVNLSKTVTLGSGLKFKISGSLSNLLFTYKLDVSASKQEVMAKLNGKLSMGCSLSADVMENYGIPSSVTICYISIAGIGKFEVKAVFGFDGEISLQYSTNFMAGFEYSSGDFRVLHSFKAGSFTLNAQVNLKAGVRAELGLASIPVLSGYIYFEAGGKAKIHETIRSTGTPQDCLDASAYIYAEVGAKAGVKLLKIIDKSWSKTYTIWNEKNSPLKTHAHWEDDIRTDKCTYGDGCVTEGYGKNGYTTPGGSKYYNNGGSSQSSTGYGTNGKPYTVYEYSLDDNKNATITSYRGNASALTVPKTLDGYKVTAIGSSAFKANSYLRYLTIPEGVTSIGADAFRNCTNLSSVNFPESLISIGKWAFDNCDNLTEAMLPSKLETLGYSAFGNCDNLQSVFIPATITNQIYHVSSSYWDSWTYWGAFCNCKNLDNVTFAEGIANIPEGLFADCTGLTSISIPDTVTTIKPSAFRNCTGLTDIDFGKSVTAINIAAFYGCTALTDVQLPATLPTLDNAVFRGCTKLASVSFPENLTSIGRWAFADCSSLTDVVLPKKLESLGYSAFGNCESIQNVYIPAGITNEVSYTETSSVNTVTHYGAFCGSGKAMNVTFEAGITSIPAGLFGDCTGLTSISIPDTVTTINKCAFTGCENLQSVSWGSGLTTICGAAFSGCSSITEAVLPPALTSIWYEAFENCTKLEKVAFPESLTEIFREAFNNCDSLTEVVLPPKLKTIGHLAFGNCDNLASVHIPAGITDSGFDWNNTWDSGAFSKDGKLSQVSFAEGIKTIPSGLFAGCTGLTSITIPDTVTEIERYAFARAENLESVKIGSGVRSIGERAFRNCGKLTGIELNQVLETIENGVFEGCSSIVSVLLPDTVSKMGYSAFYGCTALKNVNIPASLQALEHGTFYNCTSLETIVIPDKVTAIDEYAFKNCSALTKVQLGNSVNTIGYDCFRNCDALETIVIPNSVTSLGKYVFSECEKLKNVTLGNGISTIPANAFFQCPALESIIIPYGITEIGASAFANNTALVAVTIPKSVTMIGSNAFSYNDRLTIYGVAGTTAETYAAELGCRFEAINKAAESVEISSKQLSMANGSSVRITASVSPADFTDNVAWKSSNTDVVTVDNGIIAAVGVGEATVSFIAGNVKDSCTVTVYQGATDIDVSPYWVTIDPDETVELTATVYPESTENKSCTWSSSDESVAIVSADGVVTAIAAGTAEITATSVDNNSLSSCCTVTVRDVTVVTEPSQMHSEHPYAADCDKTWKYTKPGATELNVTFSSETSVEDGSDYIYIYTGDGTEVGEYTGTELAGKTVKVSGDTVKIRLVSDGVMCEYGFAVTDVTENHVHSYTDVVTAPTCTEKGYTTHTCACGESYKDSYVNALGHEYENGVCVRCGEADPNADTPTENPFTDVSSEKYFYAPVMWAVNHEPQITGGYTDGTFRPQNTCTRAQIVTFIWRAKGCPEPTSSTCTFTDVAPGAYYYKAVLWAVENGITGGYNETTFGSNDTVTRAQAMTFLWRAAGKPAAPAGTVNTFTDVGSTSYYYEAVMWAVANGITGGYNAQTFGSNDGCTRGQIVTFLYRNMA